MTKISLSELNINATDPRNNKEFLWLSYSINNLSLGQYDRTYWMTLEKSCLSLFNDKGYDLQTGAWYCLIAAQLYNWEGLADASSKFAECFSKEKKCWPPATSRQIRTKILYWYIRQVIPAISFFPDNEQTPSSLSLLEDSLTLLSELENDLFSGKSFIINNLLSELRNRKSDNSLTELQQEINLKSDTDVAKFQEHRKNKRDRTNFFQHYTLMIFVFICVFLIPILFFFLKNQDVVLALKRDMPNDFLTELSMKYSRCLGRNVKDNNSWILLKNKIDNFEEKLIVTENNGGYITISELKTMIYDMKNLLLKDGMPVDTRIALAYNNSSNDKKERELEFESIEYQIEQLNCELSELRARLE